MDQRINDINSTRKDRKEVKKPQPDELCQVCDDICESVATQSRVYTCHCKIPICNSCLASWAISQLNEQLQIEKPMFKCPKAESTRSKTINCQKLSIEQITHMMVETRDHLASLESRQELD